VFSFTRENVLSNFKSTEILLINPEVVLKRFTPTATVRLQDSDGFVMIGVVCVLPSVRLVRDEAEGRPLLVPFWTRRSMYVFSQLCSVQANTTSYLAPRTSGATALALASFVDHGSWGGV
jgi:hypothetical protein